jgi:hypothetical protein
MSSAKKFREFARECLEWARTARSKAERDTFTQMAQTWIEAAQRLELAPAGKSKPLDAAVRNPPLQKKANPQEPAQEPS